MDAQTAAARQQISSDQSTRVDAQRVDRGVVRIGQADPTIDLSEVIAADGGVSRTGRKIFNTIATEGQVVRATQPIGSGIAALDEISESSESLRKKIFTKDEEEPKKKKVILAWIDATVLSCSDVPPLELNIVGDEEYTTFADTPTSRPLRPAKTVQDATARIEVFEGHQRIKFNLTNRLALAEFYIQLNIYIWSRSRGFAYYSYITNDQRIFTNDPRLEGKPNTFLEDNEITFVKESGTSWYKAVFTFIVRAADDSGCKLINDLVDLQDFKFKFSRKLIPAL